MIGRRLENAVLAILLGVLSFAGKSEEPADAAWWATTTRGKLLAEYDAALGTQATLQLVSASQ